MGRSPLGLLSAAYPPVASGRHRRPAASIFTHCSADFRRTAGLTGRRLADAHPVSQPVGGHYSSTLTLAAPVAATSARSGEPGTCGGRWLGACSSLRGLLGLEPPSAPAPRFGRSTRQGAATSPSDGPMA